MSRVTREATLGHLLDLGWLTPLLIASDYSSSWPKRMVEDVGIEPTTYGLQSRRSPN